MTSILCFTLRFLDPVPRFHGRADDSKPEWPPSPLRFFQALTSAAATRWRGGQFHDQARPALAWLESIHPTIVAPPIPPARFGYRTYVPNNSGDLMTAAWARGDTDTSMAKFRVEKDVLPTHLRNEALHFLFPLPEGGCPHFSVFQAAARSVTHLGWGVDMVAGNAEIISHEQAAQLEGEVWRPADDGAGTPLRVPIDGTLAGLMQKHEAFLGRLAGGGFCPVPPLSAFQVIHYRRATDSPPRPWEAFSILKPDASGNRSFDTPRRCRDVAAWVRHATGLVCEGWPFGSTESFVHGHDGPNRQLKGDRANERFMYLPLPTINSGVGNRLESIRRVLISTPPGFQNRLDWIRRRLPGQDLLWDGQPIGMLTLLPKSDWVVKQYTQSSSVWSTATPVIWPGYDDRDPGKAERVLRKAFFQAGLSPELVQGIELEWRQVGFRAGTDLARRYHRPENLKGPAYHVRVRFPYPIQGPLAVGAGRYRGLGLFVSED